MPTIERRQRPRGEAEVRLGAVTGFDPREGSIPQRIADQCRVALRNGADLLAAAGMGMEDVVRVTYLVHDADAFPACFAMLRDAFGDARPGATLRVVHRFERPEIQIELELVARAPCPAG